MSSDEGFLQRWSKRKLAEKAPATPVIADEAMADGAVAGDGAASVPAEAPEPFDLSTLPSLEDLTGDSDLTAFLQKGVPESLKNAAMRRIWALDPLIRDATGPVDYAWDFNDPNSMPGFGPLSPDTDVAALLRHVMGEKDPEAVEPEPLEAGAAEAATDKTIASGEVSPAQAIAVRTGASDESEMPEGPRALEDPQLADTTAIAALPESSQLPIQPHTEADRMLSETVRLSHALATKEENSTIRKRHGGALPA